MRVLFLLLTLAVMTTEVYSQASSRPPTPIERAFEEIRYERPELSRETLFQDSKAIQASESAISFIFKERGLSEYDAEMATAAGWRHLRIEKLSPQSSLSPKELINYVAELCKLTIKSNPEGADVEIDGRKLPRRTVTIAWCLSGKRRVRVSKPGYEPVEDICEVKEDEPTECVLKLVPVQQR